MILNFLNKLYIIQGDYSIIYRYLCVMLIRPIVIFQLTSQLTKPSVLMPKSLSRFLYTQYSTVDCVVMVCQNLYSGLPVMTLCFFLHQLVPEKKKLGFSFLFWEFFLCWELVAVHFIFLHKSQYQQADRNGSVPPKHNICAKTQNYHLRNIIEKD